MSKFDNVPVAAPKRGNFRLGNMHTTTLDFGRLQVAKIMECVPNDVININMGAFCQAAPNPSPINGSMTMAAHAFFVPTRVICSEWNNYILGLSNPTLPYFTVLQLRTAFNSIHSAGTGQLPDAERHVSDFGYPGFVYSTSTTADSVSSYRYSALPLRAFNRVWFDWYRDKMHISDASIGSYCFDSMGAISSTEMAILASAKSRCFKKDYITTAFDAPAEDGAISGIPIGIAGNGNTLEIANFQNDNRDPKYVSSYSVVNNRLDTTAVIDTNTGSAANVKSPLGTPPYSLTTSVPQLRGAVAYQKWLERLLVSGKSVISRLKSIFNADDTPERLDMSEWIGGTSQEFGFKEHTASASSTNDSTSSASEFNAFGIYDENSFFSMNGQLSGHGVCDLKLGNITYHAKEHGYLLIVTSILPNVANYQGVDRMLIRGVATGTCSRFDFFTPDMENVGFQPVLMQEVVTPSPLSGTIAGAYDGLSTFGFQQRYMDYKYSHDQVSGDFLLPSTSVALQSFHLGRNILREMGYVNSNGAATALSTAFSTKVTPENLTQCDYSSRQAYDDKFTISNSTFDHFIVNYKFDISASRPMQENTMPSIEDKETPVMSVPTGGIRL